jgi:maltose alpha-D-glucosyltransferase/alpha-amylase
LIELAQAEVPPLVADVMGGYISSALLLGQRTGELHEALASDTQDPAFTPEPFTALYRRSLYQGLRTSADQALALLAQRLPKLPEQVRPEAEKMLKLESTIFARFRQIVDRKITGMRIRCHGDLHLGQVLFTGKDFVFTDFEGEPVRSITERRIKRSPLRDVAGMLRSFDYAALSKLKGNGIGPENTGHLKIWARFWSIWAAVHYLKGYFQVTGKSSLMPKTQEEIRLMLDIYMLEKAVYEVAYELNNRPDWVDIPIMGILDILQPDQSRQ